MEVDGLDAVCAGLGCAGQEPGVRYVKGEHCLENLKNLQRFLRRDHPTSRPVFKQLGKWNTVGRDLVPIISQYRDDPELVINAVKVVVFLTMPVDLASENISQQVEYMLDFKASFLHNDAIAVIMTLLEEPLEHLECEAFSEDDWKVVQLVLTLMRNLLDIQDTATQKVSVAESMRILSIRDELLEHLFQENVMDLLLALAHFISGPAALLRQDGFLFLEIFHYIFWGQNPEKIAKANDPNSKDNTSKRASGLLRAMAEEEQEQLRSIRLKDLSRHSRFCGSFVRMSQDGSKQVLKRNPFQSSIETVLRGPRFKHGPVKRIACDRGSFSSSGKVLDLLKSLADQILTGSYNVVMQSVKDDICRERNGIQTGDVTIFFEVAKFFIAYQRHKASLLKAESKSNHGDTNNSDSSSVFHGKLCGPIASTMDEEMFSMVVSRWHTYADGVKETNNWKSVTVTGSLFKEMIRMLDVVLKDAETGDRQEVRVARVLLYKVFYDQTESGTLNFLLNLLKSFDIHKQPRSHLADLIETVHVVLRIIEFLTKEDGALRVLKKGRKSSNKAKSKNAERLRNEEEPAELNKVSKSPDANTDTLPEENPDSVPNGAEDSTNLAGTTELDKSPSNNNEKSDNALDATPGQEVEELDFESEEEEEEENTRCNVEVALDVKKCAAMFADNTVIRNYCWLLKSFTTNSPATNHYITCMLQRICKDYALEPMLYQLSLFQTFYEILSNKKASKQEEHERLFAFLTKVMKNFFKKLKDQPLLFLDILFWKNRQDCHLITMDYKIQTLKKMTGKSGRGSAKKSKGDIFGDEDEPMAARRSMLEALGDDDDPEIGRDGMQLDNSSKLAADKPKKLDRRRKSRLFTEDQDAQLKELFEQHKDDPKCCQILAQAIDPDGKITAAHVRRRLKAMDLAPLVQRRRSKKQIESENGVDNPDMPEGKNTKRGRKSKNKQVSEQEESSSSDEESSDGGSDDEEEDDDDATLTQIMEKVRMGKSQAQKTSEKNANGKEKKGNETNSDDGTVAAAIIQEESGDQTVKEQVGRRKRARLRKETTPSVVEMNNGMATEPDKKEDGNKMGGETAVATEMQLEDVSLEDDLSDRIPTTSSKDINDSEMVLADQGMDFVRPLSPLSAGKGKRRRNLFVGDDEDEEDM